MSYISVNCNEAPICTITLNRPEKRNALNLEMILALKQAIIVANAAMNVRVILLTSSGDDFCAGADIAAMSQLSQEQSGVQDEDAIELAALLWQMHTSKLPIIAIAKGASRGGGLGLLAASNIVLATSSANFAFTEVKLGLIPAVISPYVSAVMGARALERYFLTAECFSAETAKAHGLVHEIIDESRIAPIASELAEKIIQNGPHAVMQAKQLINAVRLEPFTEQTAMQKSRVLSSIRRTHEAQEGLRAFLDKRKANWE